MKISKIPGFGQFGHYIDDVDFNELTDATWQEIGQIHLKGLLTILRNVTISKDQFIYRMQQFGPIKADTRQHFMKKYGRVPDALDEKSLEGIDPDDQLYFKTKRHMLEKTEEGNFLTRVTGERDKDGNPLGFFDSGDLGWHSNGSGTLTFTPEVSLLGDTDMVGSATSFIQTVDYYDSLSSSFRSELDEMILIHNYTPGKINQSEIDDPIVRIGIKLAFCPVDGNEVPLVVSSPGGHRGLHYTINTATGIRGMTDQESTKVFEEIDRGLFKHEYMYDHYYTQNNDLLLFDNSVTLHRRIKGSEKRKAFRIQYDPSLLLDTAWQPYHQPEFKKKYSQDCNELIRVLGLKNFKLPDLIT
jgi:alpha-ketoglutarate-dependent taurine dioxygenase